MQAHRMNAHRAVLCLILSVLGAMAVGLALDESGCSSRSFSSTRFRCRAAHLHIFPAQVAPGFHPRRRGLAGFEGKIFSIVMLVKTVGSLLGAPLMATLWVRGIGIGEWGLGIPYFVSAACYAAAITGDWEPSGWISRSTSFPP